MSRTDKTDPVWVKVARRQGTWWPFEDFHACQHQAWRSGIRGSWDGVCDLTDDLPRNRNNGEWQHCRVTVEYYSRGGRKLYGRQPKRSTRKVIGFEGANRMKLRVLRGRWKSAPGEDVDSLESAPRNKRHARDPWRWD